MPQQAIRRTREDLIVAQADRRRRAGMTAITIETGGCAPPVYIETERQRDQRIADEMRAHNLATANADRKPQQQGDGE